MLKVQNTPNGRDEGSIPFTRSCPVFADIYRYHNTPPCSENVTPFAHFLANRAWIKKKSKAIPHPDGVSFLIPLSGKAGKGLFTRVDAEDVPLLERFCWNPMFCLGGTYARSSWKWGSRRKVIIMARLIMNCPTDMVVDHLNFDTLDNRKCNLRICTAYDNLMRVNPAKCEPRDWVTKKNDKGRRKRWHARYKGKSLGTFKWKKEALAAVKAWQKSLEQKETPPE